MAEAGNFPFCTIEANEGKVFVPDERLEQLKGLSKSPVSVPTTMNFVDIAGLVKGAHEGAGLGNNFLRDVRNCDAIVQVVRCFENEKILHVVEEPLDSARDAAIINAELAFADLVTVEGRIERLKKSARSRSKADQRDIDAELSALAKLRVHLEEEHPARTLQLNRDETDALNHLHATLITGKPIIYCANIEEATDLSTIQQMKQLNDYIQSYENDKMVSSIPVAAQLEFEVKEMAISDEEQAIFFGEDGAAVAERGLNCMIHAAYQALSLITFYTTGPTISQAWTINTGVAAPKAGTAIHNDFERLFIRADIGHFDDIVEAGD